jgi:hypothetical protein
LFTISLAAIGYFIGGVCGLLWWQNGRLPIFAWPWVGFLIGQLLGIAVGRLAWVLIKPEHEEATP